MKFGPFLILVFGLIAVSELLVAEELGSVDTKWRPLSPDDSISVVNGQLN